MEPAEIAVVFARALDLHSRLNEAIAREEEGNGGQALASSATAGAVYQEDYVENGSSHGSAHNLKAIRDSLQVLEDNLDSLQTLQKQQKAERDDLLVELEESRKVLIRKLRDYNGSEWDIVQEAYAFAAEPVQKKDDLILPPYQSPVHDVSSLRKRETPISARKQFSGTFGEESIERKKSVNMKDASIDNLKQPDNPQEKVKRDGLGLRGRFLSIAAGAGHALRFPTKTAFVLISIVAVVAFSQLESHLRQERSSKSKASNDGGGDYQGNSPSSPTMSSRPVVQDVVCPPGKVLLVQDGVQKCFVKERVEAPFKEVVQHPDASYGYG